MAGILSKRALKVLRDPDVIHHKPRRLVAKDAVHALVEFLDILLLVECTANDANQSHPVRLRSRPGANRLRSSVLSDDLAGRVAR